MHECGNVSPTFDAKDISFEECFFFFLCIYYFVHCDVAVSVHTL